MTDLPFSKFENGKRKVRLKVKRERTGQGSDPQRERAGPALERTVVPGVTRALTRDGRGGELEMRDCKHGVRIRLRRAAANTFFDEGGEIAIDIRAHIVSIQIGRRTMCAVNAGGTRCLPIAHGAAKHAGVRADGNQQYDCVDKYANHHVDRHVARIGPFAL
jgi:hypothetical protein